MLSFDEMESIARQLISPTQLNKHVTYGQVAAVIQCESGNVYTGINIDTDCSMGFCAEHSAIADMIKHGENRIVKVIAVNHHGKIIPPCGRCREFISQINRENVQSEIKVNKEQVLRLSELLPFDWKNA
ncbi:cytidine deaminase family protein [Xenorhabdus innexi]|uniref:Cytidine deaminase n=1 Tax=Xenorhabdus innexi TaxID=290109 RepID=A0A1N6N1L2_9GAMM|nr:cytidine deaminase [Xenorhabdus innexi]PHM37010.1 cytidine deaminase [Xenorhabdus innexi]SIP74924.1 Cytidine/deoxycytidylate deaminase family protein [Xenorhabdus innexi]